MFHINKAFQFNPNGNNFHELTDFHPDIKPATYILVSRLLGTSGCSNDGNLWDWSAIGTIYGLRHYVNLSNKLVDYIGVWW